MVGVGGGIGVIETETGCRPAFFSDGDDSRNVVCCEGGGDLSISTTEAEETTGAWAPIVSVYLPLCSSSSGAVRSTGDDVLVG